MKEQVNELFKDVYDKYFSNLSGATYHQTVAGIVLYTNEYLESESYTTLEYNGIEINKNGEIKFSDYSLFNNETFYLGKFIEFLRDRLINEIIEDCNINNFFYSERKLNKPVTKSVVDLENKFKADMFDKIINRKLTIE